ncbi:hypothetical protein [Haladaptatus sp. ZSTT2]|uniref:hypothetical protein n=1 Tax=Haladaptatus sp. ZSTT2 TaxID=3120515 RepID=UPI00300F387E
MPRTSAAIPEDLNRLLEGAVLTNKFTSKSNAVDQILDSHFATNEMVRFAAVLGIATLSASEETEVTLSKSELVRLADLNDPILQKELADRLGVTSKQRDEAAESGSMLGEIRKSVSDLPE